MSTQAQHEGHALAKTGALFLSMGSWDAKEALVEESQDRGVTVTDLIRLFIAEELDIDWKPERGYTRLRGRDGNTQLRIGIEWKERLTEVREKTGMSVVAWLKDKIGFEPEEKE